MSKKAKVTIPLSEYNNLRTSHKELVDLIEELKEESFIFVGHFELDYLGGNLYERKYFIAKTKDDTVTFLAKKNEDLRGEIIAKYEEIKHLKSKINQLESRNLWQRILNKK